MKQRDLLIGIGLIVLGVLFLLGPALNLAQVGWPFFIIVPGAVLIFLAFTMPATNAALAVPGTILATIGLMLLVFTLISHWQGWAYAWTLILAATGVGTYLQGVLTDNPHQRSAGTRTAVWGLIGFIVLALFFELLIFGSRGGFLRWLVPIGLIVAGAIMLYLNNSRRSPAGRTAPQPSPPPPPQAGTAVTPPRGRNQEHG